MCKKNLLLIFATATILLLFGCGEGFYYNKAITLMEQENYSEAITYLNKVVEKNPNSYDAYINRGYCKSFIGDASGEIEDYTTAINIDSTQIIGYMNRGICYANAQDFRKALDDYEKALTIYNNNPKPFITVRTDSSFGLNNDFSIYDILLELGIAHYYLGSFHGAIDYLTYCIEHKGHLAESLYWRGISYSELNNIEAAREDLAYAIMLGFDDAKEAFKNIASVKTPTGKAK